MELYDNRLLPLASREYQFAYRLPEKTEGLRLRTRVRYHILTDAQHEMLQTKYGLTADNPYRFVVYDRTVPLSGDVNFAWAKDADPLLDRGAPHEMKNCQERG